MNDPTLRLLPYKEYTGVLKEYSVIFYYLPLFGKMYRRRVELCLAECKGGDSILEVGFGSGLTFLNLAASYKQIHGLDLTCDTEAVSKVFAKRGIHPELMNGNVTEMPYPNNTFDTVLLISILEHLKPDELNSAFAEIQRVLKPGGQVVYGPSWYSCSCCWDTTFASIIFQPKKMLQTRLPVTWKKCAKSQ